MIVVPACSSIEVFVNNKQTITILVGRGTSAEALIDIPLEHAEIVASAIVESFNEYQRGEDAH